MAADIPGTDGNLIALGAVISAAAHIEDPIALARHLRALADATKTGLAAALDAAVVRATGQHPYATVADKLGVSEAEISRRVGAHRRRQGIPARPGRPRAT
ncbi:hypothetical protein GCM10027280_45210 [Micromonospora polyrhachis]|uniref:Uncharacterized protein n=1 Tax=Micromonospora polyrhachis TaxID=1282883 RepID=A0A7W7SSM1_9ACTN|nr:hypothetical protein [Micromonospora polyrhachis]